MVDGGRREEKRGGGKGEGKVAGEERMTVGKVKDRERERSFS